MEKFLLFTSGGGSTDIMNWSRDDAALYPVSKFIGIRPAGTNSVELYFEGSDKVTLNIKNNSHVRVMTVIGTTIATSTQPVIVIADVDNSRFITKEIYDCTIHGYTYYHPAAL